MPPLDPTKNAPATNEPGQVPRPEEPARAPSVAEANRELEAATIALEAATARWRAAVEGARLALLDTQREVQAALDPNTPRAWDRRP